MFLFLAIQLSFSFQDCIQSRGLKVTILHKAVSKGRGVLAGVTAFPLGSYNMTPEKSGSWHFPPMSIFFCHIAACCSLLKNISSLTFSDSVAFTTQAFTRCVVMTVASWFSSMTGSSNS